MDAIDVLDNAYPIGLQNIIMGVFSMVLKDGTLFPLHAIPYIKTQLFL